MIPILLVGGGGHCRSCIDVIEAEKRFSIRGIVTAVDAPDQTGVSGFDLIGNDDELPALLKSCEHALVTVGQIKSSETRQKLFELIIRAGGICPVIKAPSAYVSLRSSVAEGTIIMHSATVNAGSKIGVNCIINSQALIEHDAVISSHCHISTGARVNGSVKVGQGVFVGSGAVLREGVEIGAGAVIGAGQTILKNVSPGDVVRASR